MLQYRTAAWAGVATQFWFGAIRVMILAAFYAKAPDASRSAWRRSMTYIWLGQAFLAMIPWAADAEIAAAVESGNVGYERLRPIDTYFLWFARALAWRVANVSLRAGPVFVLAGLILPLTAMADWRWRLPASTSAALLFVVSIVLTALLSSAMTVMLNIVVTAVKTPRVSGFAMGFVNLLSGLIIPLALFPGLGAAVPVVAALCRSRRHPLSHLFRQSERPAALEGLAAQTLWLVLIGLGGRAWLARIMTRIDMQGS